jgi:hypothetical protein
MRGEVLKDGVVMHHYLQAFVLSLVEGGMWQVVRVVMMVGQVADSIEATQADDEAEDVD